MRISTQFQNRFKELMQDGEYPTKTLAAEGLGITYVTFSKAYNYGIVPKTAILIKISDHFHVLVEYLLGTSNDDGFACSSGATFQERLEQLRCEKHIRTVYELAERLHIHRNNIAQWVKKGYLPELENLEIVADFFDVSLDYLLGRTDYRK